MKIKLEAKQVTDNFEIVIIVFGRMESTVTHTTFQLKFTLGLASRVPS